MIILEQNNNIIIVYLRATFEKRAPRLLQQLAAVSVHQAVTATSFIN